MTARRITVVDVPALKPELHLSKWRPRLSDGGHGARKLQPCVVAERRCSGALTGGTGNAAHQDLRRRTPIIRSTPLINAPATSPSSAPSNTTAGHPPTNQPTINPMIKNTPIVAA